MRWTRRYLMYCRSSHDSHVISRHYPISAGIETIGGQLHIQSDAHNLFNYANVPNGNEFQGSVSASIVSPGSGQQYQGSGLFNTDNAFVSAAFIYQQRDERESGDGMLIPNAHYQRNGVKLRAGYEWGKHQVDISYQNLNTNESGTPALAMDIAFIDAAWYRFGYRYNQSDASYLTLSVFGNDNQHTMDNFSQRPLMMPAMARQNDTDSVAQGIDATYVMPWQDGELTLGTNLLHNRNNSIITNPNNAAFFVNNFINTERDITSVFAQWNRDTERYLTTLGTRFTQIDMDADPVNSNMVMMNSAIATLVDNFNQSSRDETYNMLDIAATFQYRVNRNTHIVIGASQKNRAPTYFERYGYHWVLLAVWQTVSITLAILIWTMKPRARLSWASMCTRINGHSHHAFSIKMLKIILLVCQVRIWRPIWYRP